MRILTLLSLFAATLFAHGLRAQQLDPDYYTYPLKGVAGYYSANFGEMRSNHFHSGVDFKTDGVEGKPVVAVADGYVCRIFLSPSGYGKALYINHPNGTTSVYGHLQRFTPEIEEFVRRERLRLKQNRIDIACDSTRFRVSRGEEIGRSGNTGSSFGPHLHFEIRDTRTQQTLNTIAAGLFPPKDAIPPYIFRLHYLEVDTLRGIPIHSPRRSYEVVKVDENHYRLKREEPIAVGRNGYFVVEVSDRKDEVSNRYGVYHLSLFGDEELLVEYRMERFAFDRTRYCNALSDYSLQRNSNNEVMRLAKLEGLPAEFFSTLQNRGVISLDEAEEREMRIEAEDDCGNRSTLSFRVRGKSDRDLFRAPVDTLSPIIDRRYAFRHRQEGLSVLIPRYALYESALYRQELLPSPTTTDTTLVVLSPTYRLLDSSTPLHRSILVGIECFVPLELQKKVVIGSRNRKGKLYSLGGHYENGMVETSTSTLGDYFVVADTLAPQIKPPFEQGANLRGRTTLRVHLSDNFSGIQYWTAHLDGKWHPWDYHPTKGYATFTLPHSLACGEHRLVLTATDPCGNQTRWEGVFQF